MVGTYNQAFPLAPRDARDRAKERERAKSKTIDSPKVLPINSLKAINATAASQNQERGTDFRRGDITSTDQSSAPADDVDIQSGDLLNGVGSASSHASTVSEVFSTAAPSSGPATFGSSSNRPSTLTPLTINESSPIDSVRSPHYSKTDTPLPLQNGVSEYRSASNIETPPSHAISHATPPHTHPHPPPTRLQMRKPGIKGVKCTNDPEVLLHQFKITKEEAKRMKPAFEEFGGVVCTKYFPLGERHLFELVCG